MDGPVRKAPPVLDHGSALLEVRAEARRAAAGPGRALFVLAPPGPARHALLRAARRAARWRHPRLRTAFVSCARLGAQQSAWAVLGSSATLHLRLGGVALRTLGDWAGLLPGVGDVAAASIETVKRLRPEGSEREEAAPAPRRSAAAAGAELLLRHGPRRPRLLLLDGLEYAGAGDLAATAAFARRLPETRTLLLVGVEPGNAAVGDLLLELERLGVARRLALADGRGGTERMGTPGGAAGPGRAGAPAPLAPAERVLLAHAAALGPVFSAQDLAGAAGLPELVAEDRLALLARAGVLVHLGASGSGAEQSTLYAFADPSLACSLSATTVAAGGLPLRP